MQLIHTKPVFEICGMFAMDNTLIYEVPTCETLELGVNLMFY